MRDLRKWYFQRAKKIKQAQTKPNKQNQTEPNLPKPNPNRTEPSQPNQTKSTKPTKPTKPNQLQLGGRNVDFCSEAENHAKNDPNRGKVSISVGGCQRETPTGLPACYLPLPNRFSQVCSLISPSASRPLPYPPRWPYLGSNTKELCTLSHGMPSVLLGKMRDDTNQTVAVPSVVKLPSKKMNFRGPWAEGYSLQQILTEDQKCVTHGHDFQLTV